MCSPEWTTGCSLAHSKRCGVGERRDTQDEDEAFSELRKGIYSPTIEGITHIGFRIFNMVKCKDKYSIFCD